MKASFVRAMDRLYLLCVVFAGICLVVMTLIIPVGVYFRYALNSALAWPEPAATILMIYFSFIGGAAVYRANAHIAVVALLEAVNENARRAMNAIIHVCMLSMSLFMAYYGLQLVGTTWNQYIADFPWLRTGWTYMPIPICGFLTLLFMIERIWAGLPSQDSVMFRDHPVGLE
jgi:TRAP-type C4-dicarboxylate transport system permease small subunit